MNKTVAFGSGNTKERFLTPNWYNCASMVSTENFVISIHPANSWVMFVLVNNLTKLIISSKSQNVPGCQKLEDIYRNKICTQDEYKTYFVCIELLCLLLTVS